MPAENGVATEPRLDAGSFFSAVLGFGALNKDKIETFAVGDKQRLSPPELWTLYETSNYIANVVDLVPDAACQKWCIYESGDPDEDEEDDGDEEDGETDEEDDQDEGSEEDENDDSDDYDDEIQEELNKIRPHVNQAWKLARLHGWAAVIMLINDGVQDYSQPVNERNIQGISGYNALVGGGTVQMAGEISVAEWDDDPMSITYGEPLLFSIGGSTTLVHTSRLLLFYGVKKLSRFQLRTRGQLGTSVIDRCYTEFRNFDVGNNAIAATLPDFNLDIFEIPGLTQLLARQKDFAEYISGLAYARSVLKVMMVEAGSVNQNAGGYKIITRQYTGVKEILEHFKQLFAGSVDIPNTMLFNESPSGTTSGRYEMTSWAQYIANQQQANLEPELKKLINYLHLAKGGTPPSKWELEFPSILELDEMDEADIDLKQAQRLAALVNPGIVTPEEAAESLQKGIDVSKTIDLEAREEEKQAMMQFPEGMAAVPSGNMQPPPPQTTQPNSTQQPNRLKGNQ